MSCAKPKNGHDGAPGIQGPPGVAGPVGLPGITGPVGPAGVNGTSCMVQQTVSGALIVCSDGSSALASNGATGSTGSTGATGPAGQSGIMIVNLCLGTTSYPTTFVEIGFCIQNKLYAVYSENNGFLVEVPPGYYHSNAHGSSCHFTIQNNCVVTH